MIGFGRRASAATLAAIGILYAAPARSQAALGDTIGQMMGNIAAAQKEAQFEAACLAGTPADPQRVAKDTIAAEKLMDSYFKLTAKSSKRDFNRVFAAKKTDMSWTDGNAPMGVDKLPAGRGENPPARQRLGYIEAGDQKTSRAIWSVSTENGPAYYAVDFNNSQDWFDSANIWHMAITHGPTPPVLPGAYCHFGSELAAAPPPQTPPP
jgi:hypothetical protein